MLGLVGPGPRSLVSALSFPLSPDSRAADLTGQVLGELEFPRRRDQLAAGRGGWVHAGVSVGQEEGYRWCAGSGVAGFGWLVAWS